MAMRVDDVGIERIWCSSRRLPVCVFSLRVEAAEETVVGVVLEHDEDHMFDGSGWGCLDARCSYRLSAGKLPCESARGDRTAQQFDRRPSADRLGSCPLHRTPALWLSGADAPGKRN